MTFWTEVFDNVKDEVLKEILKKPKRTYRRRRKTRRSTTTSVLARELEPRLHRGALPPVPGAARHDRQALLPDLLHLAPVRVSARVVDDHDVLAERAYGHHDVPDRVRVVVGRDEDAGPEVGHPPVGLSALTELSTAPLASPRN